MKNYIVWGAVSLVLILSFQNCGEGFKVNENEAFISSPFVNPSFSDQGPLGSVKDSSLKEGYSAVGDMIVPTEIIHDGRDVTAAAAKKKSAKLWPGKVLPILFSSSVNEGLRAFFMANCAELEKEARIRCVQVNGFGAGDEQLIRVTTKKEGCYSYIGDMSDRRVQDLNLELHYGCWNLRTIKHELMHAAGFIHEHARMDRDKYVKIHYSNIESGRRHNFDKVAMENQTYYDFSSIMHYPSDAFSKNGNRTITRIKAVNGSRSIARASEMSTRDKNGLRKSYGDPLNPIYHYPTSVRFVRGHDKAGAFKFVHLGSATEAQHATLYLKSGTTGNWKTIDGQRVSSCIDANFRKAIYGDLSTGSLNNPPMKFRSFTSHVPGRFQIQIKARRFGDTPKDKCTTACNTNPGFKIFGYNKGKWSHLMNKTLSRDFETFNVANKKVDRLLVCRGAGGHHRDNIQIRFVRQRKL